MGPSRPFFIWSESPVLGGFGPLGYGRQLGRELKIDDKAFVPPVYLYDIEQAQSSRSAQPVMSVQVLVNPFSILRISS